MIKTEWGRCEILIYRAVERFSNSLPPLGKVAREAGRKRFSPHVAIRTYAPIDVVSATRTSSVFPGTMQAFSGKSTFPKGEGYFWGHRQHPHKSEFTSDKTSHQLTNY